MSGHSNPVLIRGVTYISQAAAAQVLGVSESTVAKALAAGRPDSIGLRQNKGGNPGKPCVYMGQRYPSVVAAARAWGVSERTVCKALAERMAA